MDQNYGSLQVLSVSLSRSDVRRYYSERNAQQTGMVCVTSKTAIKPKHHTNGHPRNGKPTGGHPKSGQSNNGSPVAIHSQMYQPIVQLYRRNENLNQENVHNNGETRAKSEQLIKGDPIVIGMYDVYTFNALRFPFRLCACASEYVFTVRYVYFSLIAKIRPA